MSDLLSQAARDRVAETSAAVLRKASATVSATNLPRQTQDTGETQPGARNELEQESPVVEGDGEMQKSSEQTSVLVLHSKLKPDP